MAQELLLIYKNDEDLFESLYQSESPHRFSETLKEYQNKKFMEIYTFNEDKLKMVKSNLTKILWNLNLDSAKKFPNLNIEDLTKENDPIITEEEI